MNPDHPETGPPEFTAPDVPSDLAAALRVLLAGRTLNAAQTAVAFETIMTGRAHHAQIGAFLALLATRVPTVEEIVGAARVMRAHVDRVEPRCDPAGIVDTAGTGGAPKTFNVSTAAAIIAAAAGATVAKHGNRSRTGRGSAEVLTQLGVNVDADRATQARCLDEAGICFCFAIHHHPAAKHAMPVRLALGFPTIFNLLGPLTNPAGARRQLMGVYGREFLEPIAGALAELGVERAMIVHSDDGLDEVSITAPTTLMHVRGRNVTTERFDPTTLGLEPTTLADLTARDLDHATAMVRGVLEGDQRGPARDMSLVNAAVTLLVADEVKSIEEGFERAAQTIDDGRAGKTLAKLVELSGGGKRDLV